MTHSDVHASPTEQIDRAKANARLEILENEFKRLQKSDFSDARLYSRLVRDSVQSSNAHLRNAVLAYLPQKGGFEPNMSTADFIKTADRFGFDTIGLFKSLREGHVFVLARAADAQMLLAHAINDRILNVETHRCLVKNGHEDWFIVNCFAEFDYRVEKNTWMVFSITPYLLGPMLDHNLHSGHLVSDWKSCSRQHFRRLLMTFEAHCSSEDRAAVSKSRSDVISGIWRNIFALDRDAVEPPFEALH